MRNSYNPYNYKSDRIEVNAAISRIAFILYTYVRIVSEICIKLTIFEGIKDKLTYNTCIHLIVILMMYQLKCCPNNVIIYMILAVPFMKTRN